MQLKPESTDPGALLLARGAVAASAVAAGLALRIWAGVGVGLPFFLLVLGWFGVSALVLRRLAPPPDSPDYARLRGALFPLELVVAALGAHWLGLSGWLAVPVVLFPVVEWGVQFPGWGARVAGVAGGVAAGTVVAVHALSGGARAAALGVGTQGTAGAIALFLLAALLVIGAELGVGGLAAAGRRRRAELIAANRRLEEASRELQDSHDEVHAAYAELQAAQAEMVNTASMASLGQLVAGVAHELNTPLGALESNRDVVNRALNGLQRILEDEVVTPDELDEVRRIVRAMDGVLKTNGLAVQRMVGLVGNLRTFGRPDRAEIDVVDLHECLDGTLALLAHELRGRIEVERDYGQLPRVECWPNKLNQVFMNLILNAAQATPGTGTITVRTRANQEEVTLTVEDSGVGIAPENLRRIFEPGFTTKGARMGMGLGLLIAKQIIDQHGGRLQVESRVGEGTTFTVRLPLRLPSRRRQAAPRDSAVPLSATGSSQGGLS